MTTPDSSGATRRSGAPLWCYQARTLAGAKCATVQGLQNYKASKFTQYTKFLDDRKLLSSCVNLEVKLKSERSDIDGRELCGVKVHPRSY